MNKAPSAPKPAPSTGGEKTKAEKKPKRTIGPIIRDLLTQEETNEDIIENEAGVLERYRRLTNLVTVQSLTIGIITGIMILGAPVMRPINAYYTLTPQHEKKELVSLFTPNLTSQAVLSWAATSVTEILTFGFGDFDQRIGMQHRRFTSEGWESFLRAMATQEVRQGFKSRQLVLTTVPSDMPVIVWEGYNDDQEYQWIVEMPVIMTFVTNNNVSKRSQNIVKLTIVRTPSRKNVGGMAIKKWTQ